MKRHPGADDVHPQSGGAGGDTTDEDDFANRATIRVGTRWWTRVEESILGAILVLILVIASAGVLSRYVLSAPLPWTEPLARYLLIWLTMLGAAVLVKHRAHIQITFLYDMAPRRVKPWIDLFVVLVQLAVAVYMVVFGAALALSTPATTAVPFVTLSLVYAIVPVAGLLIAAYTVRDGFDAVRAMKTSKGRAS